MCRSAHYTSKALLWLTNEDEAVKRVNISRTVYSRSQRWRIQGPPIKVSVVRKTARIRGAQPLHRIRDQSKRTDVDEVESAETDDEDCHRRQERGLASIMMLGRRAMACRKASC
jgi:hypothetical protein